MEFKVGDEVVFSRNLNVGRWNRAVVGSKGAVVHLHTPKMNSGGYDKPMVGVEINGDDWDYEPDELELIKEEAEKPMAIKVGDEVKVIGGCHGSLEKYLGIQGVIESVNEKPKFQPQQLIANYQGDIGFIAEPMKVTKGKRTYKVKFSVAEKCPLKTYEESKLTAVVL